MKKASAFGKTFILQTFKIQNRKPVTWAFLQTERRPNVVVFALTSDRKVILVDIFRYAVKKWILELPGGRQESHQTLKDAVVDELESETGCKCLKRNLTLLSRRPLYFEPVAMTAQYIPFLAVDCTRIKGWEPKREAEELIREVKLMSLRMWHSAVKAGRITDDKSLAVTLLAQPYLKK